MCKGVQESGETGHEVGKVIEFKDIQPVVVVMLSEEEMDKEDVPVGMNIRHACEVESVVGVEKQTVYPPHWSSVHTPLPRPATIPEKGLELDCVIGCHITEGQDMVSRVHTRGGKRGGSWEETSQKVFELAESFELN